MKNVVEQMTFDDGIIPLNTLVSIGSFHFSQCSFSQKSPFDSLQFFRNNAVTISRRIQHYQNYWRSVWVKPMESRVEDILQPIGHWKGVIIKR